MSEIEKEVEEKIGKIKTKEFCFQMNISINKAESKEIDRLKILKDYLYVYVVNNSIKIYNINTFQEISTLKLPFNREDKFVFDREFITLEIMENDIVLILADKKLYFYKINLKENKLCFLYYLSEVHHFCYLEKRKEIFLLTQSSPPYDYAKTDLLGKIIFKNKIIPKINYEYKPPTPISGFTLFALSCSKTPIQFSKFEGFDNDKYIINICGVTDNYDHYMFEAPRNEKYNITIFNSEDLKEILNEDYSVDLRYIKITDKLFKKCYDDLCIFYYNNKENKINFIKRSYNRLYKYFNIKTENDEEYEDSNYFYLKENMFSVFIGDYLYFIDISTNYSVKKIQMKQIYKEDYKRIEIKYLTFSNVNKKVHLYFSARIYTENDSKSKIFHGIII